MDRDDVGTTTREIRAAGIIGSATLDPEAVSILFAVCPPELANDFEEYGEWLYWITVMGEPDLSEPWGFQLDGHHLFRTTNIADRLRESSGRVDPCKVSRAKHPICRPLSAPERARVAPGGEWDRAGVVP